MSLKIYILSPHIDDAAFGLTLTISGFINRQFPVSVINCFTKTKWTGVFVSRDIEVVSAVRKQEDMEFNKLLSSAIQITNLELLDAPLRNNYIHQFYPFNATELSLIEEIKNYLLANVDGILLCPLAIGHHIDHVLCREAVIQLYHQIKILFYEDLPYANRITLDEMALHIKNLEERLQVKLSSYTTNLNTSNIDKLQAVRLYKSQVNDEICSEIMAQFKTLSGERIWAETEEIDDLKKLLVN